MISDNEQYRIVVYPTGFLVMEHDHNDIALAYREFKAEWDRLDAANKRAMMDMFEPAP